MAGASIIGASVASSVVDSISSAIPTDILAIILAVAGATSTRSAQSARSICEITAGSFSSKVSV
ncbi:hypothetical protein D3C72_2314150 [compost metagenome]